MKPPGLTRSERFVAEVCERSFLKLWTHPNPKGKKGKELCDCLVVCGPHVIIISVKEIEYRDTSDKTGWDRWTREAIDASAAQIWGAERWLQTVDKVERADGRTIALAPKAQRRYHRVAVSLGAKGHVPLRWGDLGHGFVHVCDEFSVDVLFQALDTITDFTDFLEAVEALVKSNVQILFSGGGIEDFVAMYFVWNRSFSPPGLPPEGPAPDTLVIGEGLWKKTVASPEFRDLQRELKPSYRWDQLIDHFATHLLAGTLINMHSPQVSDNELGLVVMALQPRWHRLELAEALFRLLAPDAKVRARIAQGHGNCSFVFLVASSENREHRRDELQLRCIVVRDGLRDRPTVVGLAVDRPGSSKVGYAEDLLYMHFPEWTEEQSGHARKIVSEFGYFKNTKWPTQNPPLRPEK